MPDDRGPPPLFPEFAAAADAEPANSFPPLSVKTRPLSLAEGAAPSTAGPHQEAGLPVSLAPEARGDAAAEAFALSPSRDFNSERERSVTSRSTQGTADIAKMIREVGHRHGAWQVFSDFCEMAAISFSNAVDRAQFHKREERYLAIVKRYKPDEVARFPQVLAALTMSLDDEPTDVLGRVFHELELHNKWAGQFFSPFPVCQMMARMLLEDADTVRRKIEERGYLSAHEPAVGSGAMVIALAVAMRDMDINYQQHLHVSAIDVDAKCVHMAYAQFALLHIPAVIVHGNTLSCETFGHWHTPAHIMGSWEWKLRQEASGESRPVHPVLIREHSKDEPPEPTPPGSQLTLF
jgi:hypothetical protein